MSGPDPLVLLIEDEPQMRRFLRASLAPRGFRIVDELVACAAMYAAVPTVYVEKYAAKMPKHTENIVNKG